MDLIFVGFIILYLHFDISKGDHEYKETFTRDEALTEQIMDMLNENKVLHDPHDMFAPPKPIIKNEKSTKHNFNKASKWEDENYSNKQYEEKLTQCSYSLQETDSEMKMQKEQIIYFQKQLASKSIDVESFYSRILHKFWSLLEFEEAEKLLGKGNKSVRRNLAVDVSETDISAFKEFFNENKAHIQIDNFFQLGFIATANDDDQPLFATIFDKIKNVYFNIQSFEAWIFVLWTLLIVIIAWLLILFLLDTFRKLYWSRILGIIIFLAFLISFIIHWKQLIKARVQKHQEYLEKEYAKTTVKSSGSMWTSVWASFCGYDNINSRADEYLTVSPYEEISPLIVISEVLTKFFTHPLPEVASQLGHFFNNFYGKIDWCNLIQSTVLFSTLVIVFVFAFFGYGFHLPLWLGGIYPSSKSQDHSTQIKQLIKDNEENMRKICKDAQEMLSHISQSTISYSQNLVSEVHSEQLVLNSAIVIEKNLKRIIDARFSRLLSKAEHHAQTSAPPSTDDDNDSASIPLKTKEEVDGHLHQERVFGLSTRQRQIKETKMIELPFGRENEQAQSCLTCDEGLKKNCLADSEIRSRVKNVVDDSEHLDNENSIMSEDNMELSLVQTKNFLDEVKRLMTK